MLSNIPAPYQLDFFGALAKNADVLAVFLQERETNRDWELDNKDWVRILGCSRGYSKWAELRGIINQFEPDHVIVGGYRLSLSLKLKWYCFRRGIPFYYWLEKPLPSNRVRKIIRYLVWMLTLPFARGVFCIGKEAMSAYKFFSKRVINLPYSIDASRYCQRNKLINKPLKCLYIGQYITRKGIQELLLGFSKISTDQATLTIVGSGEMKAEISFYTKKYSHIKEVGFLSPDQLPSIISQHDLLIAPSRHDGWAVVLVEAMISGLPVISTSNTGAFVELVELNGLERSGTLCEVDPESIRDAIIGYVEDPDRISREGACARKKVLNSHAESKNAAKYLLTILSQNLIKEMN